MWNICAKFFCIYTSGSGDVVEVYIRRSITGRTLSQKFVVANTLAKWKKFEPNEINSSQGFSQKVVSISCFVFPARGDLLSANNLCKQFRA